MWLHLDDRLYSHPKVDTLSNAALGLWTRALSWTGDKLTDGFIPDVDMRRRFKATPTQIAALVDAGLWVPETVDGVAGWRFHNFEKWNRGATAEGVRKYREASKKSSKKHRDRTSKEHVPDLFGDTSEPLLNQNEHTSESETNRDSAQNEHDYPTNTQVDSESAESVTGHAHVTLDPDLDPDLDLDLTGLRGVGKGTEGRGSTGQRNGAAAPGMDRTDLCPRHAHIPPGEPVPPCHDCRTVRLSNERAAQDADHAKHRQAQARREAIAACLWCDDHGWQLDPDTGETLHPAVKCDHLPEHAFDSHG